MIRYSGALEASKMIEEAVKVYEKPNWLKKIVTVKEKGSCKQTTVANTRTQIYVKSELKIKTDKKIDAFIIKGK